MSSRSQSKIRLLELVMKIVDKGQERRTRTMISLNKMQFGFMQEKGTMDAIFIVGRVRKKYQKNKNFCICVLL